MRHVLVAALREGLETAPAATVLSLPQTPELLWPLLAVVPMQILAYQMAALKGVHPDTFRRDDPTYVAAARPVAL